MYLGDEGVLGDEDEEFSLQVEGHGDDESHKDEHLKHEEGEDLVILRQRSGSSIAAACTGAPESRLGQPCCSLLLELDRSQVMAIDLE